MEGIVAVATAARLHYLHGWPKWSLGFESTDYAFDLIGRVSLRKHEWLAGEPKSSAGNVARLIGGSTDAGPRAPTTTACQGRRPFSTPIASGPAWSGRGHRSSSCAAPAGSGTPSG